LLRWLLWAAVTTVAAASVAAAASVVDTKHNLSVSGKGPVKSPEEKEVCIFCHTPHRAIASTPLWNHELSSEAFYKVYESSTLQARPGQPTGSTRLCLSCHDGTIALGRVVSRRVPIRVENTGPGGTIPLSSRANIGTDLSGMHPVSIKYTEDVALADGRLRWPVADPEGRVKLDGQGMVQCTACHDPHDDSRSDRYPFWRKSTFDEVCEVCHRIR
jgi:hypothetical protein